MDESLFNNTKPRKISELMADNLQPKIILNITDINVGDYIVINKFNTMYAFKCHQIANSSIEFWDNSSPWTSSSYIDSVDVDAFTYGIRITSKGDVR